MHWDCPRYEECEAWWIADAKSYALELEKVVTKNQIPLPFNTPAREIPLNELLLLIIQYFTEVKHG